MRTWIVTTALAMIGCAHGPTVSEANYRQVALSAVGDPVGDAPLRVRRDFAGDGVYRVYLETDGSVARVDIVRPMGERDQDVVDSIRRWHYPPRPERVRFLYPVHVGP